jgi:hypothetical protein
MIFFFQEYVPELNEQMKKVFKIILPQSLDKMKYIIEYHQFITIDFFRDIFNILDSKMNINTFNKLNNFIDHIIQINNLTLYSNEIIKIEILEKIFRLFISYLSMNNITRLPLREITPNIYWLQNKNPSPVKGSGIPNQSQNLFKAS